jgi:uncharacterized membrane-anchored protein YhcB (DUF1043 family)
MKIERWIIGLLIGVILVLGLLVSRLADRHLAFDEYVRASTRSLHTCLDRNDRILGKKMFGEKHTTIKMNQGIGEVKSWYSQLWRD